MPGSIQPWIERVWRVFGDGDKNKGVFVPSRNALRTASENESQFGEDLTTERTPIIQLNSSYGTSGLRDIIFTSGSGAVTNEAGYIGLATGATANSDAQIFAAEVGRYSPGYSAEIGIGLRLPTFPDGNKVAAWGGLTADLQNGFLFGASASGVFIQVINAGNNTFAFQQDWNIDKLDGTGDSGFDLDVTEGQIYQIDFTWYGYGQILFGVIGIPPNEPNKQRFIPCHAFSPEGEVSIVSPNLSLYAEVRNEDDAENFEMELGGRQYSIVGNTNPKFRFVSDFRVDENTDTTSTPLVTFRRKAGFLDRSVKIQGFNAICSGENHILEVYIGSTLTGTSYGTPTNHTAAETAVESDTSATALSGGILVWQAIVPASAGTGNSSDTLTSTDFLLDIPENEPVTLAARTVSGTGTVDVGLFRLKEEW